MSCDVFANNNEISCKSGSNKVIAEFPDVCLSPPSPPAGPIPVPYPNTSFSKDMQDGSRTVRINGKELMLKDKSFYKTSPLGDEAATQTFGANVLSHTITGKTYCLSWSMDIKVEGENVDRHMDMTTSNHMCAPQPPGTPPASMTIGTVKPVIPGQLYSDQTCTDADRDTLHQDIENKKKITRVQVPKRPPTDPAKKALVCSRLAQRKQDLADLMAARQKLQDECFSAMGPKTKDERARQDAHDNEYAANHRAHTATAADQTRMGC
jgi:uncharacterized protein DUF4150